MNAKHSPAPWEWNDNILRPAANSPRIATIINDDGCLVYRETPVDEFNLEIEANKRLIAAAPDLLAALEAMVVKFGYSQPGYWSDEEKDARAAIAKARGAA